VCFSSRLLAFPPVASAVDRSPPRPRARALAGFVLIASPGWNRVALVREVRFRYACNALRPAAARGPRSGERHAGMARRSIDTEWMMPRGPERQLIRDLAQAAFLSLQRDPEFQDRGAEGYRSLLENAERGFEVLRGLHGEPDDV